MITDLENQIIAIIQTIFDRFGWFGLAGMMAFENATSITPSEVILGMAGWMRNPAHSDHRFRRIPITDSGAFRSPIPAHSDHRFRPFRSLLRVMVVSGDAGLS